MKFYLVCHPERSEGSVCRAIHASRPEILRFAQDDMVGWSILVVQVHNRVPTVANHAKKGYRNLLNQLPRECHSL
jgi:hypothetical protein